MSTTKPADQVIDGTGGEVLMDGPLGAILLAGAEQTAGQVSFVIHPLAPKALGSPIHVHRREDEWSFVLEGEIGIQLGDEVSVAGPGDLVLKPRNQPHAFWNAGDSPARLLEVITPGGFERYFRGLGEAIGADGRPDLATVAALADEYGLEVDPDSVPRLAAAHGLVV